MQKISQGLASSGGCSSCWNWKNW